MAAVCWGAGDFCGGIAARLGGALVAAFTAQVVGLLLALGLLALAQEPTPPTAALALAALGGALGALGVGCFYLALSRGTMGLVAPLTALLAATIPALTGLARGDEVVPLVLVGMITALAAVVLISMPDRRLGSPIMPSDHGSRAREWLLIVGAGLGFGGFFLLIDASHDAGGAVWWPLFMVKSGGLAAVVVAAVVMVPLGRRPVIILGSAVLLLGCLAGVGDLAGNLFFVLASGEGELSVVVVLSSLYPLSTALLARVFLHERLGPLRLAGVALALTGVVLIGLGSL